MIDPDVDYLWDVLTNKSWSFLNLNLFLHFFLSVYRFLIPTYKWNYENYKEILTEVFRMNCGMHISVRTVSKEFYKKHFIEQVDIYSPRFGISRKDLVGALKDRIVIRKCSGQLYILSWENVESFGMVCGGGERRLSTSQSMRKIVLEKMCSMRKHLMEDGL